MRRRWLVGAGVLLAAAALTAFVGQSSASPTPVQGDGPATYDSSLVQLQPGDDVGGVLGRAASADDPSSLEGVTPAGQDPNLHPPASSVENERRLAEQAGDRGVTYVTESSDLPG